MSTLDFSVADISDDVVEILASYGDVYCGGSDIDKVLADHLVELFKDKNGFDISGDAMAMSRIFEAAEKAKVELSGSTTAEVNIPYISAKDGVPVHLIETITRAKFEQLISPIIESVIKCGKTALERSKVTVDELDGVLLVGGSCRIPYLQNELIKAFGDKLIKSANLDLAVAEGAAIQADIIANGGGDILLLDVTPLRLGIETEGGVMTTLIEANTTIPCSKEQIFSTASDNQPAVTINVLQGERPLAHDNKQIGLFTLDGIAPARRGVPQIAVKFDIDSNGILSVSATDKGTGKEQHITIQNDNTLTPEEIERIKKEAADHAEEDNKTRERLDKRNKVDSLIYQAENFMEEYKDKPEVVTEDDKTYLTDMVTKLKELRDGDLNDVDATLSEVEQRLMTIGSRLYQQQNPMGGDGNPFGGAFGGAGFDFGDIMKNAKSGATPDASQSGNEPEQPTQEVEEV